MMGKKSGVAKQLQAIAQHPVCIIHCVAHNLELAVLDAIKQTPYLAIFEETVKSVFKFYFYSPKRRREVNEIAAILDQDHVYYSGLQKTRWVASRFRAINALERHFLTTITHLQHKSLTKGDDRAKAKGILLNLQNLWSWVMIGCRVYFLVVCYSRYHFVIFEIVGFDAIVIYEGVVAKKILVVI